MFFLEHTTPVQRTSSFVFEDAEGTRPSFAKEKKAILNSVHQS